MTYFKGLLRLIHKKERIYSELILMDVVCVFVRVSSLRDLVKQTKHIKASVR